MKAATWPHIRAEPLTAPWDASDTGAWLPLPGAEGRHEPNAPQPKDARGACARACTCVDARVASCGGTQMPSPLDRLHKQEQVGPAPGGEVRTGDGGEAARRRGERRGAKAEDQVLARGDEGATQLG